MKRVPSFIIFPLMAGILFSLGGCNSKAIKFSDSGYEQIKKDQSKYYILGQGDVIRISVYEKWPYTPENFATEMTIREDGAVLIPPIGKVTVENMSVVDAEEKIIKMLGAFLKNPFCQIEVKEFNSHKVCILGDLQMAQTLGIRNNDRVLDILTRASGRTDRTYLGPLKLVRKTKNEVSIYDIDLKRIVAEGHLEENVLVTDGDIIFVPKHPIDEMQRFLNMLTFWVPTYFVTRTLATDFSGK